jgi:PEP-CTERM motif
MRIANLVIFAVIALLVIPIKAKAAIYLVSFQGVVSSGIDQTGVFTAANTRLNGQAFKAVYTVDDATAGVIRASDGTSYLQLLGGTIFGNLTPLFGALTINGNSVVNRALRQGSLFLGNEFLGRDEISFNANDAPANGRSQGDFLSLGVRSTSNNILNSVSLADPFNYVLLPGDTSFGLFQVSITDERSGAFTRFASGNLVTQSISISGVGAVPEPATWAFLVAGFGVAGGALRKRSRTTRATSRQFVLSLK